GSSRSVAKSPCIRRIRGGGLKRVRSFAPRWMRPSRACRLIGRFAHFSGAGPTPFTPSALAPPRNMKVPCRRLVDVSIEGRCPWVQEKAPCCDARQVENQKSEILIKGKAAKAEPP